MSDQRCVLVVDDQPDLLTIMTRLIQSMGYTTHSAASLAEAMDVVREQSIDLLISDLNLEDGSGLDLVRQVQAIRPIKAIALSGFDDAEDIRQSKAAGFVEHLRKPVDLTTLEKAIQAALA